MCSFPRWHLFFTWQVRFPAPDNRTHLRRYGRDEVAGVIYRLAMWGKADCVLGSPREFTKACTTLSASGDIVAFPADEMTEADSQRAFCSIQPPWKKASSSLKCWSSQGPEFSLIFFFFPPERKYCCRTKSQHTCLKTALSQYVSHWQWLQSINIKAPEHVTAQP